MSKTTSVFNRQFDEICELCDQVDHIPSFLMVILLDKLDKVWWSAYYNPNDFDDDMLDYIKLLSQRIRDLNRRDKK